VTGPIRCKKTGPARPVPEAPPSVEVLPPTNRHHFRASPELVEIRARFDAGDYRGCVEPIEVLFFARRNTFHQGLLQYVVALHQLGLGLVRTPRRLLGQALEYWSPYPDWQEGLDLSVLRTHAEALLDRLPPEVDQCTPEQLSEWWVPAPKLGEVDQEMWK